MSSTQRQSDIQVPPTIVLTDMTSEPVPDLAQTASQQPSKMTVASRNRWRLGLVLLGVVILLWVASGFLVNVCF